MLTVKAPGIEFDMPLSWEEVTLRQFLNLYATYTFDGDAIRYQLHDALRCLCSDVAMLEQLGDAEEAQIVARLPFISVLPDLTTMPKPIEVNGKLIPTELGRCTVLQKWTLEQVIRERLEEEKPVDYINIAVEILAIYLYPILLDKPLLDTDHVTESIPLVEALPVTVALPLSAFFLNRLSSLTPSGETAFSQSSPKPQPKRWRPRWFPSWKAMRNWRPFGRWQAGDASSTKKSNNSVTMNL